LEVGVFVTLKLLYKIFSIKSKVIWHGCVWVTVCRDFFAPCTTSICDLLNLAGSAK
jgi:hypothetical protein